MILPASTGQSLLDNLRAKGVRFKLVGGVFRAADTRLDEDGEKVPLGDDLLRLIDALRPHYTQALRREIGICIACGLNETTRSTAFCTDCLWERVGTYPCYQGKGKKSDNKSSGEICDEESASQESLARQCPGRLDFDGDEGEERAG